MDCEILLKGLVKRYSLPEIRALLGNAAPVYVVRLQVLEAAGDDSFLAQLLSLVPVRVQPEVRDGWAAWRQDVDSNPRARMKALRALVALAGR